jgi:hypothetical protein
VRTRGRAGGGHAARLLRAHKRRPLTLPPAPTTHPRARAVYKCSVKMPSGEFQRIVRDLGVLGDTCVIKVSKEGVTFSVKGDLGTGSITRKPTTSAEDDDEHVTLDLEEPVELTFALRYLNFFTKVRRRAWARGHGGGVDDSAGQRVPRARDAHDTERQASAQRTAADPVCASHPLALSRLPPDSSHDDGRAPARAGHAPVARRAPAHVQGGAAHGGVQDREPGLHALLLGAQDRRGGRVSAPPPLSGGEVSRVGGGRARSPTRHAKSCSRTRACASRVGWRVPVTCTQSTHAKHS